MKILVLGRIPDSGLDLLRTQGDCQVVELDPNRTDELETHLADTDAILVRTSLLPESLLTRAPRLKVVSRFGVGVDNIDVGALTRRGIPVAVVGDENAVSVAEHTLYLMLAAVKAGLAYDQATRSGDWGFRESLVATELAGRRLLIVGMGRIGVLVARLCQSFGMEIAYFDPHRPGADLNPVWVRETDLREALSAADIVTLHVPLLAATRGLIGPAELAGMKRSAVLVSTSRGGVVDETALAVALKSGTIRAAGLDVFDVEPVASDNPFLRLPNVVLSPHVAALTHECADRMSRRAASNCVAGLRGDLDPRFVINPEVLAAARPSGGLSGTPIREAVR